MHRGSNEQLSWVARVVLSRTRFHRSCVRDCLRRGIAQFWFKKRASGPWGSLNLERNSTFFVESGSRRPGAQDHIYARMFFNPD